MQDKSSKVQKSKDHNHRLSRVLERNIHKIFDLQLRAEREQGIQDKIAKAITVFSGTPIFVYIHIVWFGGWILVNSGLGGLPVFDEFPYGLLTMIVSLEAIFLSTFVLICQNRQSEESDRRAHLDLQIVLLMECELTRVLKMLDEIHTKLEIQSKDDNELADLEKETRPEDVLAEIERIQALVEKNKATDK